MYLSINSFSFKLGILACLRHRPTNIINWGAISLQMPHDGRSLRLKYFLIFVLFTVLCFSKVLTSPAANNVAHVSVKHVSHTFCHTRRETNVDISLWNDYRIGDGIALQYEAPGCEKYPNSIVCKYTQETREPNDVSALIRVLGKYYRQLGDNLAALHVRLGDGLCAQIDPLCRGDIKTRPDCWNNDRDCWSDTNSMTKQYAYSQRWYESVILDLELAKVSAVVIIGDKFHWTRTPDPRQGNYSVDEEYLSNLSIFFRSHGFDACVKEAELPDTDFALLCSARVFIQGGGGYSALVAKVVKQRGGTVLKPLDNFPDTSIKK